MVSVFKVIGAKGARGCQLVSSVHTAYQQIPITMLSVLKGDTPARMAVKFDLGTWDNHVRYHESEKGITSPLDMNCTSKQKKEAFRRIAILGVEVPPGSQPDT